MRHIDTLKPFALGLAVLAGLSGPALAQDASPLQPTPGVEPHAWKPGDAIEDADDLLVALETADADIRTFRADVIYTRIFALAGDEQTRQGTLWFETLDRGGNGVPASRRFAVDFQSLRVGSRVDKEPKTYIFDGEWLVEKLPNDKQFIKRQVVPPGERFDPLKIGEGPFPVPVGQRRADVLAAYEATLLDASEGLDNGTLRSFVSQAGGTHQVLLKPRVMPSDGDELAEIRVWYRKSDLLPRMARTINVAGDESVVQLMNPKKNPGNLPDKVFDTTPPQKGWDVRVEPYRGPGDPPRSQPARGEP